MTRGLYCEECGTQLGAESRFCEECGAPVPRSEPASGPPSREAERAHGMPAAAAPDATEPDIAVAEPASEKPPHRPRAAGRSRSTPARQVEEGELVWLARVPMVGDRFFFWDMFSWAIYTGLGVTVVLSVTFAIAGQLDGLPMLLGIMWLITGGVFIAGLLVAIVVFGNRYYVAYRLDARGANYEMQGRGSKIAKASAAGDVVLGALLSNPAAMGAGLLASASSSVDLPWAEVGRVTEHPSHHVITLSNSWRPVFRLHCTEATYEQVRDRVREWVVQAGGKLSR